MVAQFCNSSIQEAETGEWHIWGQSGQYINSSSAGASY